MDKFDHFFEEFKIKGSELADKIKELIHEGNVRRIIVKNEHGHTYMEIPLTIAAIGVIAAPVLAAVATIAGMAANFHVVVERNPPAAPPTAPSA
jgi:hypothetical protein